MAITNKLKPLLDQPVWEWTRFNVAPGQTSAMTAPAGSTPGRYLYNLNGTTFSRFDTFTDAFQLLNTPASSPVGLVDMSYAYDQYDDFYQVDPVSDFISKSESINKVINSDSKFDWIMSKFTSASLEYWELEIIKEQYLDMTSAYDKFFYDYLLEKMYEQNGDGII